MQDDFELDDIPDTQNVGVSKLYTGMSQKVDWTSYENGGLCRNEATK